MNTIERSIHGEYRPDGSREHGGETMTIRTRQTTHAMRITDSPVEEGRKAGPRGDADWPGYDVVYRKISAAAQRMSQSRSMWLTDEHVATMADLGSGHEERMKARLWWLRTYGWLNERLD